jgi:hypothetical protein
LLPDPLPPLVAGRRLPHSSGRPGITGGIGRGPKVAPRSMMSSGPGSSTTGRLSVTGGTTGGMAPDGLAARPVGGRRPVSDGGGSAAAGRLGGASSARAAASPIRAIRPSVVGRLGGGPSGPGGPDGPAGPTGLGGPTGPAVAGAPAGASGGTIWPGTTAVARARATDSARSRRARAPIVRPGRRTSPRASWDTNQAGR